MPDYTRVNFEDIDGMDGPIDHRFSRKHLDSKELGVSRTFMEPGARRDIGHHHKSQEEAYVVISGSGRMKLDDDIIDVKQWDVIRVAPEVTRGFEAGPDGMQLIAVGGQKPPEGDGVMVEDFWA